jgi:hypothetical protein
VKTRQTKNECIFYMVQRCTFPRSVNMKVM